MKRAILAFSCLAALAATIATGAGEPATALKAGVMLHFPPRPDRRVTLDNWQAAPFNRWSLQNTERVIPTAIVHRGRETPAWFQRNEQDLNDVAFTAGGGAPMTIRRMLSETYTDAFLVLHQGKIVTESYFNGMKPHTPHLLHTATQALIGDLAGILVAKGFVDPAAAVTDYAPELTHSGYRGAAVADLLNMATGVRYAEADPNPRGAFGEYRIAMAWTPAGAAAPAIYEFLATLGQESAHGEKFTYRSCDTDALAWVLQRGANRPLPDLLSEELWSKLRPEHPAGVTVDRAGSAAAAAGFSATLRDVGRFGQMHLQEGQFAGRQIVPRKWILMGRVDSAPNLLSASAAAEMPAKAFNRQWWVRDGAAGVVMAVGGFGQLIYVDPVADVVVVKFSSWPTSANAKFLWNTVSAVEELAARLGSVGRK